MMRLVELTTFALVFSATWLTQGALSLAVVAGIVGVVSIIVLIGKIDDLSTIAQRQNEAVEKLDTLVNRIEEAVNPKES